MMLLKQYKWWYSMFSDTVISDRALKASATKCETLKHYRICEHFCLNQVDWFSLAMVRTLFVFFHLCGRNYNSIMCLRILPLQLKLSLILPLFPLLSDSWNPYHETKKNKKFTSFFCWLCSLLVIRVSTTSPQCYSVNMLIFNNPSSSTPPPLPAAPRMWLRSEGRGGEKGRWVM